MRTTLNIGDDDETLSTALRTVLRELGASVVDSSWDVGGSQEVVTYVLSVLNREVVIETETYVGCTLSGDDDLVKIIAELVHARMREGRAPSTPLEDNT